MLGIFSEVLVLILMILIYSLIWLKTGHHPILLLIVVVVVMTILWYVWWKKSCPQHISSPVRHDHVDMDNPSLSPINTP